MAPRKSHLDCQETLLVQDNEGNTATEEEQSLVSVDTPPAYDIHITFDVINIAMEMFFVRNHIRDQPPILPFILFYHSVFDQRFIEGGQGTQPAREPEAEQPDSEDDGEVDEPEAESESEDVEADKENQDPNGRSNIQAMALAREDQPPHEEDYFDVQVVTELEQLGNTWRRFMGGALRAPQQNSPSITELFSEPH